MAHPARFGPLLRAVRPFCARGYSREVVLAADVAHEFPKECCCSRNGDIQQSAVARTTRRSLSSRPHAHNQHLPRAKNYSTISRRFSYDVGNGLLRVVREELKTESAVKDRQLQLLDAIVSDVSEPNKHLLAKLNCTSKLSGEEVYTLAAAVFNSRDHGDVSHDAMEIAASLFEYAGELEDMNGLFTFAQLLRTGQGVTPDAPRAANIFTDLALKGHPYAQFALAGMYYGGFGVEQNFTRAFSLYSVCAKNFVPQAHNVLGDMYRLGQGVEENAEEAIKHYETGAEQGDPLAHMSLAHCYTHGKGVETSTEKAFNHYLEASKSNNPVALYNVGVSHFSGKGAEQNFKKAAEYFEKASILGFYPAQVNLGNMYYNGFGVSQDKSKAKELYKMAAEKDKNAKALLEEIEIEERKAQEGDGEDGKKTQT